VVKLHQKSESETGLILGAG